MVTDDRRRRPFDEVGETSVRKALPQCVECGRRKDDVANQAKPDQQDLQNP
jgi:hypothetical protein